MHLVMIGGSDAGISAALRPRAGPGRDVTVVLEDAYPNFSICGIPYYFLPPPPWTSAPRGLGEFLMSQVADHHESPSCRTSLSGGAAAGAAANVARGRGDSARSIASAGCVPAIPPGRAGPAP